MAVADINIFLSEISIILRFVSLHQFDAGLSRFIAVGIDARRPRLGDEFGGILGAGFRGVAHGICGIFALADLLGPQIAGLQVDPALREVPGISFFDTVAIFMARQTFEFLR